MDSGKKKFGMDDEDREFLLDHHVLLISELAFVIESLLDHLFQRRVVTMSMFYEMEEMTSKMSKARWLLIQLPKRGPHAYAHFTEAVKKCGLLDLHNALLHRLVFIIIQSVLKF